VEEGRVKTQRRAMERFFKSQPKMRVVLETGTHSRWVQAIAKEQGHQEIVANPRQVRLISQNRKKSDRKDGELLGRLGRVDPELLYPIQHRGEAAQADLESFWDVWEEWIPSCCIRFSIGAKPLKRTWRWSKPEMNW